MMLIIVIALGVVLGLLIFRNGKAILGVVLIAIVLIIIKSNGGDFLPQPPTTIERTQ